MGMKLYRETCVFIQKYSFAPKFILQLAMNDDEFCEQKDLWSLTSINIKLYM